MPNNYSGADTKPPLVACEDGVLIRMAIDGRGDSFSVLMDRHFVAVKSKLRAMVSNEADLDDLLQEVLLKVWRHLANFRSESSLRTWMVSIGINEARQLYRRNQSRPVCQPIDDFAGFVCPAESPYERFLRTETSEAVRAAVAKLPPACQDVVVLRDLAELCSRETAERLHTSIEAVKSRLFRARLVLSGKLRKSRLGQAQPGSVSRALAWDAPARIQH